MKPKTDGSMRGAASDSSTQLCYFFCIRISEQFSH
jgi:hypothetical protein